MRMLPSSKVDWFDVLTTLRDPDQWSDFYFGKHFPDYGIHEVLDSHMQSFWKESKRLPSHILFLWSHMAALASLMSYHNGVIRAWYSEPTPINIIPR